MYPLQRFLADYDMAMLRALAQNRGVELTTNRRSEAAAELATAFLDPLSVRTALARLSPQGREALDAILSAGGRMRAPQFARRFGAVRPVGPGKLTREAPWRNPANATEELWYGGLIFRAFAQDESGPAEFFFVPDDLRPLLPEPQSGPPTFAVEVTPPPTQIGTTPLLTHDLFFYLVHVQTHNVRPTAEGQLPLRDREELARRLPHADGRRLALTCHLARRLEFVVLQEGRLRLQGKAVKGWLTAPPARRLAVLQEAWRDDPEWNDLCHVPTLLCDEEPGRRNDPPATRRAVLSLLARCPREEWWSLESFVAAVRDFHPDFQRPDGDYDSWYIRDAKSGEYLSGFESWEQVEGALLRDLLTGPLRWLGVVSVADERGHILCRLTEAGARFLGLLPAEEEEAPPPPPPVIHPDLHIELPSSADLYTQFQLERFADRREGSPLRYRLTPRGLQRALAQGIRVEQIIAFLRQAGDGNVPANVVGVLQTWAERLGQVTLQEVVLLTTKSERALQELLVLPETRHLIGRRLSPTSALVRKEDLPRLERVLRRLGFLS